MGVRSRTYSANSDVSEHFDEINAREVEDITLEAFYRPHTITVLSLLMLGLVWSALTRDSTTVEDNLWKGALAIIFFFIVISCLAFPNGPFTRPHPLIWRIIFVKTTCGLFPQGLSVLYFLSLVFLVFQDYSTARYVIGWISPDLKNFTLRLPDYAVNCNNLTVDRLLSHFDVYMLGHSLGWAVKALLLRHYGLCWAISITWELTELCFIHLLPNFAECWWDAIFLDVFLCNALGIHIGMWICKHMELRNYHWESVKDIQTTTGKIRRCVLQFTPETWTANKWLDPNSSAMRVLGVSILVIEFQISELNTFFLKHIFEVPTNHHLTLGRLAFIALISAPAIRQYYSYVTDTQCTRLGTQAWVYVGVNVTELIICLKFGHEIFLETQLRMVICWILCLVISGLIAVYVCAMVVKHPLNIKREKNMLADLKERNLNGSGGNLGFGDGYREEHNPHNYNLRSKHD